MGSNFNTSEKRTAYAHMRENCLHMQKKSTSKELKLGQTGKSMLLKPLVLNHWSVPGFIEKFCFRVNQVNFISSFQSILG